MAMNISEAVERVNRLKKRIDAADSFLAGGFCQVSQVILKNGHREISIGAPISVEEREDMLKASLALLEAERDKYQSVIDMANAALRGIEA